MALASRLLSPQLHLRLLQQRQQQPLLFQLQQSLPHHYLLRLKQRLQLLQLPLPLPLLLLQLPLLLHPPLLHPPSLHHHPWQLFLL